MLEFVDYRRVQLEPSIVVDRSRGEKLVIEMDITFPKVPCYREWLYILGSNSLMILLRSLVLSLDVIDISGEHQMDLEHDISKTRVSKEGRDLETITGRLF